MFGKDLVRTAQAFQKKMLGKTPEPPAYAFPSDGRVVLLLYVEEVGLDAFGKIHEAPFSRG